LRHSLLFFALCSALDEVSTFLHLYTGGSELNPNVTHLLGISPLLYPLFDIVLILLCWVTDRALGRRIGDLWLLWASAGIARLICLGYSLS
jgi:hypothetical protein